MSSLFDPTQKKKKKRRKRTSAATPSVSEATKVKEPAPAELGNIIDRGKLRIILPIMPDDIEISMTFLPKPVETTEVEDKPEEQIEKEAAFSEFSSLKKRKKKKKKSSSATTDSAETPAEAKPEGDAPAESGFEGLKKKKKRKSKKKSAASLFGAEEKKEDTLGGARGKDGEDESYTYEEMLNRVFVLIKDKQPTGGTRKVIEPAQVQREGSKKAMFVNFESICRQYHRPTEHFQNFILSELGTTGSLDKGCRLIIRGRFSSKQIDNVLRRYETEYVICHGCSSLETLLSREGKHTFVRCERCGAHRSVQAIKGPSMGGRK